MGGSTFAATGPGYGFGLGFGIRTEPGNAWAPGSVGEATWSGSSGTLFWIDPQEKLVGIMMAVNPGTRLQTRFLYKNLVYAAFTR